MNQRIFIENTRRSQTMEKAIQYLRSQSFVFVSYETIQAWGEDNELFIRIPDKIKAHSFMIREIEPGSMDKRGKFEYFPCFAIKLNGHKNNRIKVIEEAGMHIIPMPWEKRKAINFKKLHIGLVFPKDMPYEDRKIWRRENDKLKKNPEYEPNDLYRQWDPLVKKIPKN